MKYAAELKLAERAAREAGALLRAALNDPALILSEEGRDIKIEVEREAEGLIKSLLAPTGLPFLGEESGESSPIAGDGPFWVADPLDGTFNYARGLPISCVSLALVEGARPRAGVTFDFNRDELFAGGAGFATTLNGTPVRVSDVSKKSRAALATGFPVRRDYSDEALWAFVRRAQAFKKVRMLGSAALSCAWVACGRVDAYIEENIMLWDVAAGAALVEGAGGVVSLSPCDGERWAVKAGFASSAELLEE